VATSNSRYLEFFYFDAGGGHRSAANALRQVIAERLPLWQVEMVNLQQLLQTVDPLFRLTKIPSQNVYNGLLRRGWTYGSLTLLRGLQTGIRIFAPQMKLTLQEHWQHRRPDLVVSLIPNFNGVMFEALRCVHSDVPYVTIMTDLIDFPPHFWLENQKQFVICGTGRAVRQARSAGYLANQIFKVSGMILKPEFYIDRREDRRLERVKLGLDPDLPTALIMFGGNGSKTSIKIVEALEQSGLKLQTIVMCGSNEKLQSALGRRESCLPVGFTNEVFYFMRVADFFIGKPGPGSISEAVHSGLPVIVERNKRTMPQERYNGRWVVKRKVGVVVKSFKRVGEAVQFLLKEDNLELFRKNAAQLDNQAVFEIPDIFAEILSKDLGREQSIQRRP
jgi:UDP-N-acetylglucosamine:LPS N-acetylglucosamine transferase